MISYKIWQHYIEYHVQYHIKIYDITYDIIYSAFLALMILSTKSDIIYDIIVLSMILLLLLSYMMIIYEQRPLRPFRLRMRISRSVGIMIPSTLVRAIPSSRPAARNSMSFSTKDLTTSSSPSFVKKSAAMQLHAAIRDRIPGYVRHTPIGFATC